MYLGPCEVPAFYQEEATKQIAYVLKQCTPLLHSTLSLASLLALPWWRTEPLSNLRKKPELSTPTCQLVPQISQYKIHIIWNPNSNPASWSQILIWNVNNSQALNLKPLHLFSYCLYLVINNNLSIMPQISQYKSQVTTNPNSSTIS